MKFTLILATVGRTREVARFLESLDAQSERDFELIVVDQNGDERLAPVLERWRGLFPIVYLRSQPGLSRARNLALAHVRGEIVAFPDDDCWYPADLLLRVAYFLDAHVHVDGLNGRAVDRDGAARGRWARDAGPLTRLGVFNRSISYAIFLRRTVIERVGRFDETLGLGAATPWQGGEDWDYQIRALDAGFRLHYRPEVLVYHDRLPPLDDQIVARTYRMSRGSGRILRRHRYPLWYVAWWFAGSLGLTLLALAQTDALRARYHWKSLMGKLEGWAAPAPMKTQA
jgi:glycosyltransferase involved in cell wall biosynthesis